MKVIQIKTMDTVFDGKIIDMSVVVYNLIACLKLSYNFLTYIIWKVGSSHYGFSWISPQWHKHGLDYFNFGTGKDFKSCRIFST